MRKLTLVGFGMRRNETSEKRIYRIRRMAGELPANYSELVNLTPLQPPTSIEARVGNVSFRALTGLGLSQHPCRRPPPPIKLTLKEITRRVLIVMGPPTPILPFPPFSFLFSAFPPQFSLPSPGSIIISTLKLHSFAHSALTTFKQPQVTPFLLSVYPCEPLCWQSLFDIHKPTHYSPLILETIRFRFRSRGERNPIGESEQ